jgi:adenylate cyclase
MVQTLLGRRALLPPPPGLNLALLLAACLAVALLALWLRPLGVAVASLGLVAVLTVLSYEAYTRGGYWLDVVAPVAGMLLALQADRVLGRRRLRAAFGQFVSPDLLDRVLREGAALGGEVRVLSVLMSDLRGFTTLSERLPPAAISAMMNEYFTEMVEVILARGGYVSDFIGDGILAVFGAPGHDPDHAWHAVQTALAMQDALAALNRRWAEADGRHQPLAMGVAVNTGEAFVGNIGSPKKKKYSVLGDTVNTVSRIEGLNRDLGTGILISGGTLAAVEARVTVRDRGRVTVKGRVQAVEIHELMGAGGEPGGAA